MNEQEYRKRVEATGVTIFRKNTRRLAPIMVEVITRNLRDLDQPPTRRTIDYRHPDWQRWLRDHMFHCFMNGKSVTLAEVEG